VSARDPHDVLGVAYGATPEEIRSAWRSLARQHHPDLTADDPEAARRATRRMAEINAAYATLIRADGKERRRRRAEEAAEWGPAGRPTPEAHPGAGIPPSPRTTPITGRLDTSSTYQPRNQTTTPPGLRIPLSGQPPLRHGRSHPELRASRPSGPLERDLSSDYVPLEAPTLDDALDIELPFGKFHGHTLGEVAAFEPSYIDWLAGTLTREPEITLAARVIREELDRRGVRREHRPMRPGWQSNPFR
jgi:curved DNA-binding protein CbpA